MQAAMKKTDLIFVPFVSTISTFSLVSISLIALDFFLVLDLMMIFFFDSLHRMRHKVTVISFHLQLLLLFYPLFIEFVFYGKIEIPSLPVFMSCEQKKRKLMFHFVWFCWCKREKIDCKLAILFFSIFRNWQIISLFD